MENQDYYGMATAADSSRSIGDALRALYDPSDFVVVKNIDKKPITYQCIAPEALETFSDYPGHKDTVMHKPPQRFTLQPGETKLCPAYEADMMISNLVKQILINRTQDKINKGELNSGQAVDWSNPAAQDALLDQIYLGKHDILNSYNQAPSVPENSARDDVEEALNIENEPRTTRPKRPTTEAA
jgi:hypothetical protein